MASSFKPVCQPGSPQPRVAHFTPDPSGTFVAGDLVYFDTADNLIKECGADPSLILGVARCSVADALALNASGLVPVDILEPDQVWHMGSATTPSDATLLRSYGIVQTSGVWLVDTSDTSNTRVTTIGYSPRTGQQGPQFYAVKFNGANLQGDGVAS